MISTAQQEYSRDARIIISFTGFPIITLNISEDKLQIRFCESEKT